MVRIGARIHDLIRSDVENVTEALKNSGVEAVQLTLPKFVSTGEPVGGFDTNTLGEIKRVFDEANIKISVLSCYINPLLSDIEKERKKFFRYVDYAKAMGVSIVGTETGSIVSDLKDFSKNHTQEVFERLLDNVRPILEYADEKAVTVGIESVAYFPVYDEKRFMFFKNAFADKDIRCIFDPVNLLYYENYQNQQSVMENFVKACAKDIRVVHLKDFTVENGWLEERPLFSGNLDLEFLVGLLKRYNVRADFILENVSSLEEFKKIKTKLKEIINRSI